MVSGVVRIVIVGVMAAVILAWAAVGATQPASSAQAGAGTPLVELVAAATTTAKVQVAGTLDHSSLKVEKLQGESTFAFVLKDPHGNTLRVVAAGRPPFGLERADTVVVIGRWRDGAFRAAAVLIPGSGRGLLGVMTISMTIWLGLFIYVFSIDRRLRGLER